MPDMNEPALIAMSCGICRELTPPGLAMVGRMGRRMFRGNHPIWGTRDGPITGSVAR
jgi:hypothetical protein